MPSVRLPDGSTRDYPPAARVADCITDAARAAGKQPQHPPVAALLDGSLVGLDAALPGDGSPAVEPLFAGDPRALTVMRHSAAHVMARAVMRLFE